MSLVLRILGQNGVTITIGLVVFLVSLKYSSNIFQWIENQTFGTKNYIIEQLELMFIKVKPEYVTYMLLFLSFGQGILTIGFLGLMGAWKFGVILGVIFAIIGWKIPKPFIRWLVSKRIKKFQNQTVDGLTLLSNGIRAGLSLPQALDMVVKEMPPPISQEFNLILQQNKIGVPLDECFENFAKRIPTEDNEMFVASINILRETGGNLAETFDTIVEIIRERIRLQQKVDSYTAQGMFQGAVIFSMPWGIGIIYAVSDPDSMVPLFTTPIGIIALFIALCLDFAGGFLIMKIVRIKI